MCILVNIYVLMFYMYTVNTAEMGLSLTSCMKITIGGWQALGYPRTVRL